MQFFYIILRFSSAFSEHINRTIIKFIEYPEMSFV